VSDGSAKRRLAPLRMSTNTVVMPAPHARVHQYTGTGSVRPAAATRCIAPMQPSISSADNPAMARRMR